MEHVRTTATLSALSSALKLVVAGLGALTIIGWLADIEVLASLQAQPGVDGTKVV